MEAGRRLDSGSRNLQREKSVRCYADLIIDVPKIQSIATWRLHITEAGGAIMAAFKLEVAWLQGCSS
jgi:hypothetical protein